MPKATTGVVKSNSLINLHYTQLIVHASWPLYWFLRIVRSNIPQRSEITLLSWWEVLLTFGILFCPQVGTERIILTWQVIHCWLLWTTYLKGDIYRERKEVVGHSIRGRKHTLPPTLLHVMWVQEKTPYTLPRLYKEGRRPQYYHCHTLQAPPSPHGLIFYLRYGSSLC